MDDLFRVIVVSVAEDEPVAVGEGYVFGATHHCGKEGIGDVGNDHPDDVGLVEPQAAGELAGLIAECVDGVHDALAQRFADGCGVVEDV